MVEWSRLAYAATGGLGRAIAGKLLFAATIGLLGTLGIRMLLHTFAENGALRWETEQQREINADLLANQQRLADVNRTSLARSETLEEGLPEARAVLAAQTVDAASGDDCPQGCSVTVEALDAYLGD